MNENNSEKFGEKYGENYGEKINIYESNYYTNTI